MISYFIDSTRLFNLNFLIEINHYEPDKDGKKCCRPVINQKSEKHFRVICIMLECFKDICCCSLVYKPVINKIQPVHGNGYTISNKEDILQNYPLDIFIAAFQRNNMQKNEKQVDIYHSRNVEWQTTSP